MFLFFRLYLPFAAGYFLSFLFRVINGAIAQDLSVDMNFDSVDLGLVTSVYFLSFALAQLPLGILLDIYPARKVEASLLCIAALGGFIFSLGDSLWVLLVGRFLIGLGVSACLMAAFQNYSLWFPKEKLGFINCMQMVAGGLGALSGGAPVEVSLAYFSWREIFVILSFVTLLVAAFIYFVIPDKKINKDRQTAKQHVQGIIHIFKNPVFWQIAPITILTQSSALAVLFLWGEQYLIHIGNFDRSTASEWTSIASFCMIIGYFVIGFGSDYLIRKKNISYLKLIIFGQVATMISLIGIILVAANHSVYFWISIGFFMGSGILSYSYLTSQFSLHLSGRVNTALNLLVFMASFLVQWFVGVVVNFFTAPSFEEQNTISYSKLGFSVSFSMMALFLILSLLWFYYRLFHFRKKEASKSSHIATKKLPEE